LDFEEEKAESVFRLKRAIWSMNNLNLTKVKIYGGGGGGSI